MSGLVLQSFVRKGRKDDPLFYLSLVILWLAGL